MAEKSWIRTQPPAILSPSDPTVQLHLEKENNKGGKLALIVLPGWLKENCMQGIKIITAALEVVLPSRHIVKASAF